MQILVFLTNCNQILTILKTSPKAQLKEIANRQASFVILLLMQNILTVGMILGSSPLRKISLFSKLPTKNFKPSSFNCSGLFINFCLNIDSFINKSKHYKICENNKIFIFKEFVDTLESFLLEIVILLGYMVKDVEVISIIFDIT